MDYRGRKYHTPALNPKPYSDPNKGRGRQVNAPAKDMAAVGYEVLDRAGTSPYDPSKRRGLASPVHNVSGYFYDD